MQMGFSRLNSRQYFNIPLDYEPYVPIKRSFLICASVIASFGYIKEHDGSWVKKGARNVGEVGHEGE